MNTLQESAVAACQSGRNVFITGPPGTGKSYTLNYIISYFRSERKQLGITASTGCAAVLINGTTVHSFLKIGLGKGTAIALAQNTHKKQKMKAQQLAKLEVLIIDEISMIDAGLLSKIDAYMKIMKGSEEPFGGTQIILVGDFYQLAPVNGKYSFEDPVWDSLKLKVIKLTECVRQSGDAPFQKLLGEIREGVVTTETMETLANCNGPEDTGGVEYTKLYSRNTNVDKINEEYYEGLRGQVKPSEIKTFKHTERDTIDLCAGCQVMVTHNIDIASHLVNGTKGIVLVVNSEKRATKIVEGKRQTTINTANVVIRTLNGRTHTIEMLSIKNDNKSYTIMPLKYAWATTIHKSQGATIDLLEIDLGTSIFAYGQAYTALSRARSMDSLKISDLSKRSFKTDKKVIDFYTALVLEPAEPMQPLRLRAVKTTTRVSTSRFRKTVTTSCGHEIKIAEIISGGVYNGKWDIKIYGPKVVKRWKQFISEPNMESAEETYTTYLRDVK
uniref:AAA+ ATPase domain-containing protein n=1 Tax=viral metagenome TaxID=1070528 RepID=A0A6C0KD65_9ZZZZ